MIKSTLCTDDAVGETRRALLDPFGKPFRLEIERWSERGKRARLDEIWWGRAAGRGPGGRGWFVDLRLDADGLIETTKASLTEGTLIPVRIKAEAWGGKGPLLSLADMKADVPRPAKPGFHAPPADEPFLRGVEIVARIEGEAARRHVDAAIEQALAVTAPIPGGGELAIERTTALTAVDVDAGGRTGADPEEFAHDLNLAAAEEAARQISLRGIAGLVMVDFVSMEQRRNRKAASDAFRAALAAWLGRASEVLEVSSLGVCEAAIARRARPLADALHCEPAEREALDAVRLIESEGRMNPAAKLRARVSADAMKWLEADAIGWKAALAGRIGARWTIEASPRRPGPPEVWAER